jgi:hypothetical protein
LVLWNLPELLVCVVELVVLEWLEGLPPQAASAAAAASAASAASRRRGLIGRPSDVASIAS